MKKVLGIAVLILVLFGGNSFARADERILRFDSVITVNSDSSLTVSETIKVRCTGNKIRHGIYRDFPTRYKDKFGNNVVVGFDLVEVQRDGQPEDYHFGTLSNGKRIYIGKKDYLLSAGDYTYILVYRTTRQVGFFNDHDELYFNVTGNAWEFPIDKAWATIDLPGDTQIISADAFTGYSGDTGKDFEQVWDYLGRPILRTTRTLQPQEGLTIVVFWPKGVVQPPTDQQKWEYFMQDNAVAIGGVFVLLLILGYYVYVWYRVGRNPKRGTIIPLFHPPENISPAMMRYIEKEGYDLKTFTAAILNLAVEGYIKIEEKKKEGLLQFGKTFTLQRTPIDVPLCAEERAVVKKLFGNSSQIELTASHAERISGAITLFKESLEKNAVKIYFLTNRTYFFIGIALSLLFYPVLKQDSVNDGLTPVWILGIIVLTGLVHLLFYHLLKAPTLAGRKIMDQIEGFKMYLATAEKERLNKLNPPEKTPELFEKYLPYALALDVEQQWAEQFSDVLAKAAQSGQGSSYSPSWYSGSSWNPRNTGSFTSGFSSGLSAAVAASSTPPGSSSGGGGGGFSGGGGGGGGGGGW